MRAWLPAFLLLAALGTGAAMQIDEAVRRIDAAAVDAEGRLRVATAMGERLKVHRNRVAFLRRETGRSYGQIFVATLRERGASDEEIERELRGLLAELEARTEEDGGNSISPVLTVTTALDRSYAATYYSVAPEAGVENRYGGVVIGAPFYRAVAGGVVSQSIGDVYAAGYLRGKAAGLSLLANLSVGFPTGDADLGLGAGRTSVDGRFTVAHDRERARIFASAGGSNFLFNNFVYQRPYVSEGPAAHFSGGAEVYPLRRLAVGAGAFAVQTSGAQTIATAPSPEPWLPPQARGRGIPARPGQPPSPDPAESFVPDLSDRGLNGWATVALSRQVWLEFAIARSFPFELTTVRVGLVFSIFGRGR